MSIRQLRDVTRWRERLGFLPVPLRSIDDKERFVLLNGPKGNFCLDITDASSEDARAVAWSTDTGYFVSLSETKVHAWRWDQFAPSEFTAQIFWEHLERFPLLLEREAPSRERSIVAHFMRGYRSLRSGITQLDESSNALNAFLALLVKLYAMDTNESDIGDLARLQTPEVNAGRTMLDAMNERDLEHIIHDMKSGLASEAIAPRMQLVFRHAAGRLFQEAHYLAEVSPQGTLYGPDPIVIRGKGSATGAYFTPTSLVRAIVERTFAIAPPTGDVVTVFDPACGGAEFLREALRTLGLKGFQGKVRLIGWDVSPSACAMARFALACETHEFPGDVEVSIELTDSLTKAWPSDVSYILTNPPFQSWRDMKPSLQDIVRNALGDLQKGRPDLASVFLLHAARSVAADGAVGFVLPASILDGTSAAPIRRVVSDLVSPAFIARLGNHQIFESVTVDTAVFIGVGDDRAVAGRPPVILWSDRMPGSSDRGFRELRRQHTDGRVAPPVIDKEHFSVYAPDDSRRAADNWTVRPYKASQLLTRTGVSPVEKLFSVNQGVLTGLNAAFVVPNHFVAHLPKGERQYFRPALMNDSIVDGQLFDQYRVFYPYGDELEPITSEKMLKEIVPRFYEKHLVGYRDALKQRSGDMARRWWELTRPRNQQFTKTPKLVSKYFGRRGAFAFDYTGEYVVVQGYLWMPKKTKLHFENPGIGHAYVALLSSALVDDLLAAVSNSMAGGQWNLSARFVKNLPIPDLASVQDSSLVEALSELGRQISAGNERVDAVALEKLAQEAWGLSADD